MNDVTRILSAIEQGEPQAAERLLPIAAAVCWLIGDLAIVFGAFMAAHWLRFVLPSDPASAIGMSCAASAAVAASRRSSSV